MNNQTCQKWFAKIHAGDLSLNDAPWSVIVKQPTIMELNNWPKQLLLPIRQTESSN